MRIIGILLAAGSGSRFGGGKLLHPLADGTPIGVASLRNLKQALPEVVAVVRAGDDGLQARLEAEGVAVHVCHDAQLGMSRSFVCGVAATAGADGWIIALGDMPFLLPGTIGTIARRVKDTGGIVIPAWRGTRGHPIGFGKRYREELLEVRGDEGARAVIKRHTNDVEVVECDDPGILRDIDSRADLD